MLLDRRFDKLTQIMDEMGGEAVLLTQEHSLRYFSGFSGGEATCLITKNGEKYLITDSRYTTQAARESCDFEVLMIGRGVTTTGILVSLCEKHSIRNLIFEDEAMVCSTYMKLRNALAEVAFLPVGDRLIRARMVKDKAEAGAIAAAEEIGSDAFRYILEKLRPGMTELYVAAELESFMKKAGAENLSFDTIVASGYRSSMPHGAASKKIIEAGDFVTMDFGCIYEGYCSDMTRTVVMGEPSPMQKEIYNTVLRAQNEAISEIQPGKECFSIDKAARDIISEAGYGQYFGHGLGHGVGLAIHEAPMFNLSDHTVLSPGMVITVEPGIYLPDRFGVRIEDVVLITEEGIRNLTTAPKELIQI